MDVHHRTLTFGQYTCCRWGTTVTKRKCYDYVNLYPRRLANSLMQLLTLCSIRLPNAKLALTIKQSDGFGEARRDVDLERDRATGSRCRVPAVRAEGPRTRRYEDTHTTSPSSTHPSTSIGMESPCSSFPGSILHAQSIIAMSMKSELFATCFPGQIRLPNPYVT